MTIQWYPGHMAKAKRLATEKLHLVDVAIELVDARIPFSSRNPVINEIIGQKPRIIVLNKSDLADPQDTAKWIQYFESHQIPSIAIDAQHNKGIRQLQDLIRKIMVPYFDSQKEKGIKPRAIRMMILGIPNVGKSTLINRFVGRNQAITGNKPGVTRAQQWLKIKQDFELLDTPGILWPKFEDPVVGQRLAITGAIKDDLLHMDDLALVLIDYLKAKNPNTLIERYRLSDNELHELTTPELLLAMTERMNLRDDYEEMSRKLLIEYRRGILGRYTLDPVDEVNGYDINN